MSPDRSHLCMSLGRSLLLTATLEAVVAGVPIPPTEPHPASNNNTATAVRGTRMGPTLRERLAPPPPLWQHADGLDMPHDLQAATSEYVGWLQLEANRSPNTVRAYQSKLSRLMSFLAANGHTLALADLRHEDLRAYQRYLAGHLKGPASRARALVAIRSCLRGPANAGTSGSRPGRGRERQAPSDVRRGSADKREGPRGAGRRARGNVRLRPGKRSAWRAPTGTREPCSDCGSPRVEASRRIQRLRPAGRGAYRGRLHVAIIDRSGGSPCGGSRPWAGDSRGRLRFRSPVHRTHQRRCPLGVPPLLPGGG